MLTWKDSIVFKFQTFYYTYIVEIPTTKEANSYKPKLSKIGK